MKGLTIIAFLVLGAMALTYAETQSNNDWKNPNTSPDYKKLMDKQVNMNGKEVNVGRLVELLHRIGSLSDTNKLTLNTKVNVNGKPVEADLPQILKLFEGISETDSNVIDATPASPKIEPEPLAWKKMGILLDKKKIPLNIKVNVNGKPVEASLEEILKLIENLTSDLPEVTVGANTSDREKVAQKLNRISKMNWQN